LISQLLHEENLNRRHQGFTALFGAMEQGLTRPALELLFSHHGSLKDWRSDVFPRFPGVFIKRFEETLVRELEDYSLRQKVQILNFLHQEFSENPLKAQRALEFFGEAARSGRYDFSHIEPAFQYARFTPFGRLILRRMLLIFATEDIPAKLEELKPSPDHNTLALAREAAHHGIDLPTLALTINGTRHTAYLRDQRLALKWVAIMAEMAGYFELSLEERQLYRRRFHHTIQNFLRSGALLTPERLMDLIHTNATPQTQRIRERWAKGDFEVRFATDAEMDALLSRWKQVGREISHLFYRGEGDRPHQVLLRLFSAPNPPLSPDSYARQTQLIHHARGLIHETEHWSHFTGQFEGIEAGGKSFPILQLGREARLATEIMALLSDNAWMTRNVTETDWEIARRMGLNLPLYYRAIADHGYFGRTNHRLAKILF